MEYCVHTHSFYVVLKEREGEGRRKGEREEGRERRKEGGREEE